MLLLHASISLLNNNDFFYTLKTFYRLKTFYSEDETNRMQTTTRMCKCTECLQTVPSVLYWALGTHSSLLSALGK
jgi:hypothetical protein